MTFQRIQNNVDLPCLCRLVTLQDQLLLLLMNALCESLLTLDAKAK